MADQRADRSGDAHRQRAPERDAQRRLEAFAPPIHPRAREHARKRAPRRHGDPIIRGVRKAARVGIAAPTETRSLRRSAWIDWPPFVGKPEFVAGMGAEGVLSINCRATRRELVRQAALFVDFREFDRLLLRRLFERLALALDVALSRSACELTETYSPPIAIAPAAQPASAAVRISERPAAAAATPTISSRSR